MATLSVGQVKKLIEIFEKEPDWRVQRLFASGLLTDLRDAVEDYLLNPGVRDEIRRVLGLKPLNPPLLERLGTHLVPATTTPFIASEKFKLKKDGGICSYLGDNFTTWFLGKTEGTKRESTLRSARLTRNSLDKPILDELGDKAETSLAEMFAMMEAQADGKEGNLLVNGYANIFYVRDVDNMLRAVDVSWRGDGWLVRVYSVEYPIAWNGGFRVFFRNSRAA